MENLNFSDMKIRIRKNTTTQYTSTQNFNQKSTNCNKKIGGSIKGVLIGSQNFLKTEDQTN